MLVNPYVNKKTWKLTDAHEFGHKLGLRHREDHGIMDYPPEPPKRDTRRVLLNDRKRLEALYR
ncbi:MAG: matrixin family metalloprotease [Flavobacteriales bacterium]|nr:matrixin family metalloprotease [Flavobacteriales bacterium]